MIFRPLSRSSVYLRGEKSAVLSLARGRIVLISAIVMLAYIFMAARAFDLMVMQGVLGERAVAQMSDVSSAFDPRTAALPDLSADAEVAQGAAAARGDILDRNGVLLATTLKTASLFADPKLISNPQAVASGLVKIFPEIPYGEVLKNLQSQRRFVWIKRGVLPEEQYKVLELGEPGLDFRYENRRVYPQGALGSHLVGYTNIDTKGQAGVERGLDGILSSGKPISLTLDIRLQHVLRREMRRAVEEFSALGAAGVILDAHTGEILAGVSLPDFDPHIAPDPRDVRLFNRLTLGTYELGSVFKIFSTAAFLEAHDVPMSTTFDASEPIKIGRFTINDYHAEDRILTVPEVFMYSSNIGSAMMGQAVGGEALRNFYSDLGLLSPLDFEIQEVAVPQVPNPWREVSTVTAAYGHGLATTPLQLATAVASVVNDGLLVKPRLVLDQSSQEPDAKGLRDAAIRIVSSETSYKLRQLLRLTVTDGTGGKADVPGFKVGGKTGTAEKISGRGYDKKRLLSSFVGIFPSDAPRYVVYIAVDEPKGTKASFGYATAGWVAAPAAARVIASMASVLGLRPEPVAPEQELGASLKQFVAEKRHGG